MNRQKFMLRVLFYSLGMFLIALGVAVSINSNLGVSPITSLPYVLSLVTGIDLGVCVTAVLGTYILIQIIVLHKEFKWINLTQLLFSAMFGYFVDISKVILGNFAIPTYQGRLLMLAISIFLVGFGVAMYIDVKLVPMPADGLTKTIAQKAGRPFYQMKMVFDCACVICAVLLSFIAFGRLHGVREGTVICAVLIGLTVSRIQKLLKPVLQNMCFEAVHDIEPENSARA